MLHWEAHLRGVEGGETMSKGKLLDAFSGFCDPVPAVLEATNERAIIRSDLYSRDPVDRWVEGPITLLGDAAHPMVPYGGQGACQALEDAVCLARCLAAEDGVSAALRTYESKRSERTAKLIKLNRRLARVVVTNSRLLSVARDVGATVALRGPALRGHRANMTPVI
jgi:2-polyprenyl-6-methoxyphenol hydroxylase-like FAD-dependent oxidoreductase